MSTSTQRGTQLPRPATPLIGREQEIAAARRALLRDDVRLLSLLGPPGIGKTRLALAVASGLIDAPVTDARRPSSNGPGPAFDGGVWFVPLAPVSDPDL